MVDVLDVATTAPRDKLDRLAERIWRLERQALMFSIGELGVTVVRWSGQGELCSACATAWPVRLQEPRR